MTHLSAWAWATLAAFTGGIGLSVMHAVLCLHQKNYDRYKTHAYAAVFLSAWMVFMIGGFLR